MTSISLPRLIGQQLWQQKFAVVLLVACIITALAIVQFAHLNRQLITTQDKLYHERDQLDIEWRNLLLEQRALSEHSRVEDIARHRLNMIRPSGAQDIRVTMP
ncbi:cell division protein FtsL [Rheinheimera sp. MMS21-TC3]|uniref:cell division protein FtsL n=1 Tax=Rheinheimera sp. MMS21-TC3 TaxID=3072790 RepID=UPI0028C38F63|nr:cell division protein FtsL [Rheinheimera sp. MMS21-TC3]WNO60317.1 cell division protein FtsL [Rheinheimera sp. MMS21-TC3]